MMKIVRTATIDGTTATDAIVSVEELEGEPNFRVTGQGNENGRQTAKRVGRALREIGMEPEWRNLGIEIRPESSGNEDLHDLPIALGILALDDKVPELDLTTTLCVGGLTGHGGVIGCRGLYAIGRLAADKHLRLIVPAENGNEARLAYLGNPIMASKLENLVEKLGGAKATSPDPYHERTEPVEKTFLDIQGWEEAKVALEIATCGRHHLGVAYEVGAPAIALIRRAPRLLPAPRTTEHDEIHTIYSLAGMNPLEIAGSNLRAFRAPHYTASMAAVCGIVKRHPDLKTERCRARPGELSLAHGGVLLVDNPQDWNPAQLEQIALAAQTREACAQETSMPAACTVMVTTPIGEGANWRRALQSVHALGANLQMAFRLKEQGEVRDSIEHTRHESARGRRVETAWRVQEHRYKGNVHNGNANEEVFAARATLTNYAIEALKNAGEDKSGPTARVARTIADLRESKATTAVEVEEALSYKP